MIAAPHPGRGCPEALGVSRHGSMGEHGLSGCKALQGAGARLTGRLARADACLNTAKRTQFYKKRQRKLHSCKEIRGREEPCSGVDKMKRFKVAPHHHLTTLPHVITVDPFFNFSLQRHRLVQRSKKVSPPLFFVCCVFGPH